MPRRTYEESTTRSAPRAPALSRASPSGWAGPRTAPATPLGSSFPASRLPSVAGRGTAAPCTRSFQVFSTPPFSQKFGLPATAVWLFFFFFLKARVLSLKFKFRGLVQFPPLKSFLSSFGSFRNLGAPDCSSQSQRRQSGFVRRRSPAHSPLSLPSFLPLLPLPFPLPLLPLKFPAP